MHGGTFGCRGRCHACTVLAFLSRTTVRCHKRALSTAPALAGSLEMIRRNRETCRLGLACANAINAPFVSHFPFLFISFLSNFRSAGRHSAPSTTKCALPVLAGSAEFVFVGERGARAAQGRRRQRDTKCRRWNRKGEEIMHRAALDNLHCVRREWNT